MKKLLKSSHGLRLFFLITAVIGWASSKYEKNLLQEATPIAIAVFDAFLTFIALLLFVLIRDGLGGLADVAKSMQRLALQDMSVLGLMSLYGAGAGLVGASLLEHHGVVGYRLTRLFISLAVGAVAMYVLSASKFDWTRGLGMALVAGGGYLVLRD